LWTDIEHRFVPAFDRVRNVRDAGASTRRRTRR
jgi:hypothetical protein